MGLFVLALFCLLSLTCFGYSTNKHMICKDVGDVSADVTNSDVHTRRLIGLKVEEATCQLRVNVDEMETQMQNLTTQISATRRLRVKVDRMETHIQQLKSQISETRRLRVKVDILGNQIQQLKSQISETRRLRVKVDGLGTQIQQLKSQISETRAPRVTEPTTVVRCVGGVIHERICYWAAVHRSRDTTYAEAEGICSNKGSTLADIYGKVHYDLIMNFLRGKLHGNRSKFVWTGMKKIYKNNIAQLSNGSPAPYTRQLSSRVDWDDARSSYTHVYLRVTSSTNDPDQGMGAFWPSWDFYGALCQTE